LPATLDAVLRPYQKAGFEFLAERTAYGIGPILADDMGLGKTLQALALFAAMQEQRREARPRILVVCPASVVDVWLDQARQFCPALDCRAYRGERAARHALLEGEGWSILVTTYALVRLDAERFFGVSFDLVVLDEAQRIKNPDARISQVIRRLRTDRALAMTGTPLENRLLDLWSIMEFLNPGFLGSREAFLAAYAAPGRGRDLAARLAPIILRRTKEAVAPELPPRTEELLTIDLLPEQRSLYEAELARARETLARRGPIEMLAALTRLRQICCHPALLGEAGAGGGPGSAKLETLLDMLAELVAEGHSALVFSQFTTMLGHIGDRLEAADIPRLTLTGETPAVRRAELVRDFNTGEQPRVFLLSLRAAGAGITLTRADYVFLYDPWWNPAVERQAIDRTHRIGQDKPVFAYRLISRGTVEEKVLALQAEKARLFQDVLAGSADRIAAARLTAEDFRRLLA
jgi:SNF2 family DNA or RNA helicase